MMARKKNKKEERGPAAARKSLFSERQRRVLLVILVLLVLSVPVVDIVRCKSACMKRVKTPYPEIACRYECPWPWEKAN